MSHGTPESATKDTSHSNFCVNSLLRYMHVHEIVERFQGVGYMPYPGCLPDEVCPTDRQLVLNDQWSSSHNLPVHQRSVLLQRPQDDHYSKQCSGDMGALLTQGRLASSGAPWTKVQTA